MASTAWDGDDGIIPEWTFGDRLRKARELAGLEQRELAERVGVTNASISNWETGINQPRDLFVVVGKWADTTGVSEKWLLTG